MPYGKYELIWEIPSERKIKMKEDWTGSNYCSTCPFCQNDVMWIYDDNGDKITAEVTSRVDDLEQLLGIDNIDAVKSVLGVNSNTGNYETEFPAKYHCSKCKMAISGEFFVDYENDPVCFDLDQYFIHVIKSDNFNSYVVP